MYTKHKINHIAINSILYRILNEQGSYAYYLEDYF